MANHLSQRQFAILTGCSSPAVVQAIRAGRLVDVGEGIDIEHPLAVEFAEAQAARGQARGNPPTLWEQGIREAPKGLSGAMKQRLGRAERIRRAHADPPKPARKAPVTRVEGPHPPRSPGSKGQGARPESVANDQRVHAVDAGTKEIERARKAIGLQEAKINYLAKIKKLIPASWHYRAVGRIAAVFNDHMRTFPDRHADQLEAMAKAGAERAQFFDYLDAEIDKAMVAVQRACDKEIQTWRDEETPEE